MNQAHSACIGRFAPSPTGPLHAGSLVAALASWLDVRARDQARGGRWLVRMEDIDAPRCVPGADDIILQQLAACGLVPDEPPVWQSQRAPLYARALERLVEHGQAYACSCTRADIARAHTAEGRIKPRHGELVYPGTCRQHTPGTAPHAWRLQVPSGDAALMHWVDRRLGPQSQALDVAVGDFVIKRSDGLWAYQLAVVVDDAEQGITHIVRGEDLADNTPRQIWLQRCLGLPTPTYLHTPLVCGPNGEKLSKQNGAEALDLRHPVQALSISAQHLARNMGWPPPPSVVPGTILTDWLAATVAWWRDQVTLNGVA